jgi:hypothetical protein
LTPTCNIVFVPPFPVPGDSSFHANYREINSPAKKNFGSPRILAVVTVPALTVGSDTGGMNASQSPTVTAPGSGYPGKEWETWR